MILTLKFHVIPGYVHLKYIDNRIFVHIIGKSASKEYRLPGDGSPQAYLEMS